MNKDEKYEKNPKNVIPINPKKPKLYLLISRNFEIKKP